MARLELQGVTKVYPGGVQAVRELDLTVEDGAFVVLVGPSGCGKSTTLRMIAGLEPVTQGTIRIGDRAVNALPPKDRELAMVFQNYALYPHMTVRENMAFGLKLRRFSADVIETRVREAAEMLGLTGLLDRTPRALSGGQRQRVAVGRAIVRHPAAFLFDEPLSNLDAKLRVEMRAELSRLHARLGATMLYVTHDQVEAMTMGERIVVMREGVVQQAADPITLYDAPCNRFVAGFVGSPPMNFFDGSVVVEAGPCLFRADAGFDLPVGGEAAHALAAYAGKRVLLGLRPEHVGSLAAERGASARIRARVEVIEPMGAETHVHCTAGGAQFVCRMDPHRKVGVGEILDLPALADRALFFDPGSEARIG